MGKWQSTERLALDYGLTLHHVYEAALLCKVPMQLRRRRKRDNQTIQHVMAVGQPWETMKQLLASQAAVVKLQNAAAGPLPPFSTDGKTWWSNP